MITIIVNIDIVPNKLQDFIKETKIARDHSLSEDGCVLYTINYDPRNENNIILVEAYKHQKALDFHKTTDHFLRWRENVADMGFRNSTVLKSIL